MVLYFLLQVDTITWNLLSIFGQILLKLERFVENVSIKSKNLKTRDYLIFLNFVSSSYILLIDKHILTLCQLVSHKLYI